jgi:hypothetical protein
MPSIFAAVGIEKMALIITDKMNGGKQDHQQWNKQKRLCK